MTRHLGARLGWLAGALAMVVVPVVAPGSANADPLSACTPSTGTVVAVDFGHWSGPIVRGCGVTAATAYDLLHAAGFSTAGDQHDGPGFVCRIGSGSFQGGTQYPTAAQDPCVVTPPATAYWSFWRAEPGDTRWTYSPYGATSYHPQPGEVELWRYGSTSVDGGSGGPPYSPAGLRAAAPVPSRPTSTRAAPTTATVPTTAPRSSAVGTPPRSSTSAAASATTSAAAASTTSTGVIQPSVVAATAAKPPGGGSATPAVLGLGGVAVLAAAAGGLAWRRRGANRSG